MQHPMHLITFGNEERIGEKEVLIRTHTGDEWQASLHHYKNLLLNLIHIGTSNELKNYDK